MSRAADSVTTRVGLLRLPPSQLRDLARLVAAELAAQQAGPGMTLKGAREYVGVSDEFFREHVLPEIPVVRKGTRRIFPRGLLDTWLLDNAEKLPAQLVEGDG